MPLPQLGDAAPFAGLTFLHVTSRVLDLSDPGCTRASLRGIISDLLNLDAAGYGALLLQTAHASSLGATAEAKAVCRTSMLEETDFTKEAGNLAEFGAYLDAAGMRGTATCPYVYAPFSSRK